MALAAKAGFDFHLMKALLLALDESKENDKRRTPLMHFSHLGHPKALALALSRGEDPVALDHHGNTALHIAAEAESPACAKLLIAADPSMALCVNEIGMTPLMNAALLGRIACVHALIAVSDTSAVDMEGWNALICAADEGALDVIALLLPSADPGHRDRFGLNALDHACAEGHAQCIPLLLTRFDPRLSDSQGRTALMRAAIKGREACAQALIEVSDLSAVDASGLSAAQIAKAHGHPQLSAMIQSRVESRELSASLAPAPALAPKKRL